MRWIVAAATALLVTAATAGHAEEPFARTFRPGAMAGRTAEAAAFCRERGGEAVLLGIDYLNSPEGAFHRARFACGPQSASEVPVTYLAEDSARLRTDIEQYCRARNASGAKFTAEPAASANVSKGSFRCE
ncbi:hypothetical protein [Paracraurococcus lichenis]|uniref:Uncharacterized protein n=1 Tax=Paracraurococcus lichenis TaxID=3064888 RepID=A0ABT9EC33_9PROT|nr:hypothetical protein [Paracraurococcus sp. LOR1-02]MDO9713669.1 hypothetical protein [Paracraurococcus sp. LOR1-02]